MFLRSRPKHERGQIVALKGDETLLIKSVHWLRLDGESKKSWTYRGTLLEVSEHGKIRSRTGISGVLECDIIHPVA